MRVAVAGEAARIIVGLKRMMKARAITYKELAGRIKNLSEVSIKLNFLAVLLESCSAWSRYARRSMSASRSSRGSRENRRRRQPNPSPWNRSRRLPPIRICLLAIT